MFIKTEGGMIVNADLIATIEPGEMTITMNDGRRFKISNKDLRKLTKEEKKNGID